MTDRTEELKKDIYKFDEILEVPKVTKHLLYIMNKSELKGRQEMRDEILEWMKEWKDNIDNKNIWTDVFIDFDAKFGSDKK